MTFIESNFHHCHTVHKNLSTQLLWWLQKRFICCEGGKKWQNITARRWHNGG